MQRIASGRLLPYLGAVLIVLVASSVFHFYYRDNFSTHFPIRTLATETIRGGELPMWNWHAGGGQPLAGNPNTLTFYPDSLLYLIAPPRVAFNAHFWLHLIAAFLAMRALTRGLGATRRAAVAAGVIYVASGAVISATAFYNLITATALIPFALHRTHRFVERCSWRDAILLGGAFGLLVLAGEPVMVVSALLGALAIAATRLRPAHLARGFVAVALATLIASPLLVAWSEVADETERGARRYSAGTALAASVPPLRLLESVTAPFLGFVTDRTDSGYMASLPDAKWPPLFISLFVGALVIPAAGARGTHATVYRILLFLAAFLSLGRFNPIVAALFESVPQLRIARYPEKFALLATVAACVLVAAWISEREPGRVARILAIVGAVGIVAATALAYPAVPPVAGGRLAASALLALAVLTTAALRGRRHMKTAALILTLAPLIVIHASAIPLDLAPHYTTSSSPGFGARVWRVENARIDAASARDEYRIRAASGDPLFGSLRGTRFALDRSPEGMYSLLSRFVQERASGASGLLRLRYARLLGCDRIESRAPLDDLAPVLDAVQRESGAPLYVYRVEGALPYAFAPQRLIPAASIQQAVGVIESAAFDERTEAVVPPGVAASASGTASVVSLTADGETLRLAVESGGDAVVVVNESYFDAWQARSGGANLRIFPVNVDRLGILVPRGRTEVELAFGRQRRLLGAATFVSLVVLAAVGFASRRRSRTRTAVPAR